MLDILNVIAPVFALMAVGYLAVRLKLYPAEGVSGLVAFVNNFATPCLLFRAMLGVDLGVAFNIRIIAPYYIGALLCFALGIAISRIWYGNRPGESVSAGFAGMFTNTVLVGLPIIQRAYGEPAMPVIFSIIGIHAAILLSTAMVVMELARRDGGKILSALRLAAKRVVGNPLLIGIGLGLAGNLLGVTLPEPADAFTFYMAQAVLPVALFAVGGALNAFKLADSWAQAAMLSALKLAVHPAIAWVLMVPVLGVDPQLARYGVLLAAMPTGINAYVFATFYARATDVAANTILIGTVTSVLSVSLWLWVLG